MLGVVVSDAIAQLAPPSPYMERYVRNDFVSENTFITKKYITAELPELHQVKHLLPQPLWDGHNDYINCYWKTWEIAFSNQGNLRRETALWPTM